MFFKKKMKKYCVVYNWYDDKGHTEGYGHIDCNLKYKSMESIKSGEENIRNQLIEKFDMINPKVIILNLIELDN